MAQNQLALFRVVFASALLYSLGEYWLTGHAYDRFLGSALHFPVFEVLDFRWPGVLAIQAYYSLMVATLILWGVAGTKSPAVVFGLCYGVLCFYEGTYLNNHDYLILLIVFLYALQPTPKYLGVGGACWQLNLLRFQVLVVYGFGFVVKLQPDWLNGQLPQEMLARIASNSQVPSYVNSDIGIGLLQWGGLLIDGPVALMLLWPKTRLLATGVLIAFHLANAILFNIGPFPWMMIGALYLFVGLQGPRALRPLPATRRRVLVAGFCLLQVVVPLRRFVYKGQAVWTYDGYRFSWMMMASTKDLEQIRIYIETDEGSVEIKPREFLRFDQIRFLGVDPLHGWRFANYLAAEYREWGNPKVFIEAEVSLNARAAQPFYKVAPLNGPKPYWNTKLLHGF